MTARDAFTILEPPPGGLGRLRARLEAKEKRRAWLWAPAATLAVAAAATALVFLRPTEATMPDAWTMSHDPTLAALGVVSAQKEAVSAFQNTAVLQLASNDENVLFYRVGSTR